MNYAQSSVSAQIQQIEEELGVRLFERMGKRLLLTKEGEELEVYARKILQLSEEAKHKIGNHNTGCIKIGASESLAMTRLSKIIEQFHKKFPDIELHLRVLYTEDVAVLLQENEIDLALVLHTPFQHPSLSVLWEENEENDNVVVKRIPLRTGELIIVPKGVFHRPVVTTLTRFLMMELEGTLTKENSGDLYES